MKATLDFDLNDPDDRMDHERCVKAEDMAIVIWEFAHNSKKTLEYEMDKNPNFTPYDAIDAVFAHFWELLNDQNINIDKLIR